MEEEIEPLIIGYMEKYNMVKKYMDLKPALQKQLIQIEQFFQVFLKEQKELLERLKNNKLNLAIVSNKTNISRSSVYNSPDILKKYIIDRITEIEDEDLLSKLQTQKRDADYELLKNYLDNVRVHLIENNILEMKISEMEKEIAFLSEVNNKNALQISKLSKENETLKLDLLKHEKNNVIVLK